MYQLLIFMSIKKSSVINKFDLSKDNEIIKIKRGDYTNINKEIKKIISGNN